MWDQEPVYLKGSQADQYLEHHKLLDEDSCLQISRTFYDEWQQQENDMKFSFVDANNKQNQYWIYIGLIGQIINVGIQQQCITNCFRINRFVTLFLIFSVPTLVAIALVHTFGFKSLLILILFFCYQLQSIKVMESHPYSPCINNLNIFRKQMFVKESPFDTQYLFINEILITPLQKLKIFGSEQCQKSGQKLAIYFRIQSVCKKLRQVEQQTKIQLKNSSKFHLKGISMGNTFKKVSSKIINICIFSFVMFQVNRYLALSSNAQSNKQENEGLKPLIASQRNKNRGFFHKLLLFLASQNNGNHLRVPTENDRQLIQIIQILRLQFIAKLAVKKQQKIQEPQSFRTQQEKQSDIEFIEKSISNNNYRVLLLDDQSGTIKQQVSAKPSKNILELKLELDQMIKKKQQKIEKQECKKQQSESYVQNIHKRQRRVEGFGKIALPNMKIDSSFYLQ